MMFLRISILLTAICCAFAFSTKAEAACPKLAFCSCSATATGVAFGVYDPFSASPHDATGTLTVNCTFTGTITATYEISLSAGNSGAYAARRMTSGTSALTYNLYNSAARNQIWGDGSDQSQKTTGSIIGIISNQQAFTIYGRIPAGQNVASGLYADTIVATVAY